LRLFYGGGGSCTTNGADFAYLCIEFKNLNLWPVTSEHFVTVSMEGFFAAFEGNKFRVVERVPECQPEDCNCWKRVPAQWEDRHEDFRKETRVWRRELLQLEFADVFGAGAGEDKKEANAGNDEKTA
jgi:hypothetical protein